MGGGWRFAHAKSLAQSRARQLLEFGLGRFGQWSRATDAQGQRTEVDIAVLHARMVVDGVIERWHAGEERRAECFDIAQHIINIARVGHQHDLAAAVDAGADHNDQAIDMKERNRAEEDLVFGRRIEQVEYAFGHQHVGDQTAMPRHGGFGHAGCAARILEDRQVIGAYGHIWLLAIIFCQHILEPVIAIRELRDKVPVFLFTGDCEEQFGEPRQVFLDVGCDDRFDFGARLYFFDESIKQRHAKHKLGIAIVDLMRHFLGGIGRISGCHDAAGFQNGVEADDKSDRIGHDDCDAIALLQPHIQQRRRQRIRRAVQLFISDRLADAPDDRQVGWRDQRRMMRDARPCILEQLMQRDIRHIQRGRHANIVILLPGSFGITYHFSTLPQSLIHQSATSITHLGTARASFAQPGLPIRRESGDFPRPIQAEQLQAGAEKAVSRLAVHDFAGECQLTRLDLGEPDARRHALVIASGFQIPRAQIAGDQEVARPFDLCIAPALLADECAAAFFKPDQIGGVMHEAHGVCFGIAHMKGRFACVGIGFGHCHLAPVWLGRHLTSLL